MATNFIMWIRILFKESVHTVVVAFDDMKNTQTDNSSCNPVQVLANASKLAHVLSNQYGHENHGHHEHYKHQLRDFKSVSLLSMNIVP